MNVVASLVAYAQPAEMVEPSERALDDPTVLAQPFAAFDATTRDPRHNTRVLEMVSVGLTVVAFVGMDFVGLPTRTPSLLGNGGQGIYHLGKDGGFMDISPGHLNSERKTVLVRDEVALRPRFAPVGRVFARRLPPFGAGTQEASTHARDQSI